MTLGIMLATARRIVMWLARLLFYWMALKVCVGSLMICNGWHRQVPDWNPWLLLIDAGAAIVMYGVGRMLESIGPPKEP